MPDAAGLITPPPNLGAVRSGTEPVTCRPESAGQFAALLVKEGAAVGAGAAKPGAAGIGQGQEVAIMAPPAGSVPVPGAAGLPADAGPGAAASDLGGSERAPAPKGGGPVLQAATKPERAVLPPGRLLDEESEEALPEAPVATSPEPLPLPVAQAQPAPPLQPQQLQPQPGHPQASLAPAAPTQRAAGQAGAVAAEESSEASPTAQANDKGHAPGPAQSNHPGSATVATPLAENSVTGPQSRPDRAGDPLTATLAPGSEMTTTATAAPARQEAAALGVSPTPPGPVPPPTPMSTPPPAAATAPRHAAPANQVAPVIVALALGKGPAPRMTLRLDPGMLGQVEIRIERGPEGAPAQVKVLAERPETLALLQRDAPELSRSLQQAGLSPETCQLSFGLDGGATPQDRGDGGTPSGGGRRGWSRDTVASTELTPPPPAPRSLLDIAI